MGSKDRRDHRNQQRKVLVINMATLYCELSYH